MIITTNSRVETLKLSKKIAGDYKNIGGVVLLTGDLGSGKTTFVQGFAKALGIKQKIISPTFVLIRQHAILNSKRILFHVDLYRINDEKDLGIDELIQDKKNIVLIEWADKLATLPKSALRIEFKRIGETKRQIILSKI